MEESAHRRDHVQCFAQNFESTNKGPTIGPNLSGSQVEEGQNIHLKMSKGNLSPKLFQNSAVHVENLLHAFGTQYTYYLARRAGHQVYIFFPPSRRNNVLTFKKVHPVGTKGVSQVYHLSFDDNKVLKNYQLDMLNIYSSVQDYYQSFIYKRF